MIFTALTTTDSKYNCSVCSECQNAVEQVQKEESYSGHKLKL